MTDFDHELCCVCYPGVGGKNTLCETHLRRAVIALEREENDSEHGAAFTATVQGIIDTVIPARYAQADRSRLLPALTNLSPLHEGAALLGAAGRGKTFQAALLMMRGIEHAVTQGPQIPMDFQWHSAAGLFEQLRTDQRKNDATRSLVERLIGARVLVIDDLGAERPTEWVRERLTEIIDGRYAAMRPVIVTSNLLPQMMEQRIGARVTGRLIEMCQVELFEGPNLRDPKHRHLLDPQTSIDELGGAA